VCSGRLVSSILPAVWFRLSFMYWWFELDHRNFVARLIILLLDIGLCLVTSCLPRNVSTMYICSCVVPNHMRWQQCAVRLRKRPA
jgi:hypothetical protein